MTEALSGGELVVRSLAAHGVELVFGIPGTHNLPLYAHLDAYGVRHVSPRHEQGAGHAADGYARVSGRPGVVVTTAGPAVMNAAAAAGQAQSDSVPQLVIAPGMPRAHPSAQTGYLHEMRDQVGAMRGVAGHAVRVMGHDELAAELAAAFIAFRTGRPGARYVEVPLDLLAEASEVALPELQHTGPPKPAPAAIAAAVERLRDARAPGDRRRRRRGRRGRRAAGARRAARRAGAHHGEREGDAARGPPAVARRAAQPARRARVPRGLRRRARGRDRAGGVRPLGPAAAARGRGRPGRRRPAPGAHEPARRGRGDRRRRRRDRADRRGAAGRGRRRRAGGGGPGRARRGVGRGRDRVRGLAPGAARGAAGRRGGRGRQRDGLLPRRDRRTAGRRAALVPVPDRIRDARLRRPRRDRREARCPRAAGRRAVGRRRPDVHRRPSWRRPHRCGCRCRSSCSSTRATARSATKMVDAGQRPVGVDLPVPDLPALANSLDCRGRGDVERSRRAHRRRRGRARGATCRR